MSLLMEALKQQQNGPIAPNAVAGVAGHEAEQHGRGWKVLALVLLVLVGLLAGFLIASWLQRPVPVAAVVATPPQPASAGQILTALLTLPAGAAAVDDVKNTGDVVADPSDEPQLLVSAKKPARKGTHAGQSLEQQPPCPHPPKQCDP